VFVKNLLSISPMTRCLLWVFLLLLALPASAELEVFTLRYRSAEKALPVVQPMLEQGGAVSAMDGRLIVRTSTENLAEIRQLLSVLDTPLRRLKITVLQDVDSETAQRMLGASGSVGIGNARIGMGGAQGGNSGAGMTVERGGDRFTLNGNVAQGRETDHKMQTVRVVEGGRAHIQVGQAVPVLQRQTIQVGGQVQIVETAQLREANSGFDVVPRLQGERVTLEVQAQNDRLNPNAADGSAQIQQVKTTISGRLGEWLPVGDVMQQYRQENRQICSGGTSRLREQRSILLRVEAE